MNDEGLWICCYAVRLEKLGNTRRAEDGIADKIADIESLVQTKAVTVVIYDAEHMN